MTVTREQAQMLATLAVACRPNRAPTWDAVGVMAAIGKVQARSLSEVILAVIRAASDRECVSPGVIPSNGSHWQEQLKPEKWEPDTADKCRTCGKTENVCRSMPRPDDDHAFENRATGKRDKEAAHLIVQSLKAELAPTAERPAEKTLDDLTPDQRDPRADVARAALTTSAQEASNV